MTQKFPEIVSKIENFKKLAEKFEKRADDGGFKNLILNYERYSEALSDFVNGVRSVNEDLRKDTEFAGPNSIKINECLMKQADLIEALVPQLEAIESVMAKYDSFYETVPSTE